MNEYIPVHPYPLLLFLDLQVHDCELGCPPSQQVSAEDSLPDFSLKLVELAEPADTASFTICSLFSNFFFFSPRIGNLEWVNFCLDWVMIDLKMNKYTLAYNHLLEIFNLLTFITLCWKSTSQSISDYNYYRLFSGQHICLKSPS